MPLCHNSWTHAGPPSRLARTRAACTHQSFRAHTLQVDCRSGALIDVRMDDEPDCPGVTFLESGLCLLARHAVHGRAGPDGRNGRHAGPGGRSGGGMGIGGMGSQHPTASTFYGFALGDEFLKNSTKNSSTRNTKKLRVPYHRLVQAFQAEALIQEASGMQI